MTEEEEQQTSIKTEDTEQHLDLFEESEEETEAVPPKEVQSGPAEQLEYVQLPKPPPDSKLHYVRLPNILGLETKPFDPLTYEVRNLEEMEDEAKKIMLPEAIRWKYATSSEGKIDRESNARFVRWSDGSLQLFVGSEAYDVTVQDISQDNNYLFVRQKQFIKCHGNFQSKLIFRPSSLGSKSHQKLTSSMQRHKKERRIKLHVPTVDPEVEKAEKERVEDDLIKARAKMALERKRKSYSGDKELSSSLLESGNSSADDIEEVFDDPIDLQDEGNIGAIKAKYKKSREKKRSKETEDDKKS